jgi:hypothetical protein
VKSASKSEPQQGSWTASLERWMLGKEKFQLGKKFNRSYFSVGEKPPIFNDYD